MIRILLLIIMLFGFSSKSIHATILVLVVTKNEIILAADSKLFGVGDLTKDDSNNHVIDKLINVNHLYYAFAGLTRNDDSSFSIPSLVHQVIEEHKNFQEIKGELPKYLEDYLKNHLSKLEIYNPSLYKELLIKLPGGTVILVGNEGMAPAAYFVEYKIISSGEVSLEWELL